MTSLTVIVPSRITFDIETKFYTESPYDAEVSLITLIDSENPRDIQWYSEDDITECLEVMLASPGFVTFNGKAFDFPVFMKYIDRATGRALRAKPHYDIYDEFMRKHQRRISLANMSRNTIISGKFDESMTESAPAMWRHNPEKLRRYNVQDTYVTYLLYLHTVTFGYVYFKLPTLRRFTPETISRPGLT